MVLPGVTIGENSVIGAGSVVTKDIPENVVAFGSPCKVYREINEHDKSIISETDDLMSSRRESKRADKENR